MVGEPRPLGQRLDVEPFEQQEVQVADPGMAKKLPNAALYRYSFISPIWSPDFAGWSVLLTGVILLIIILRLVILVVLRILLKRHYRAA